MPVSLRQIPAGLTSCSGVSKLTAGGFFIHPKIFARLALIPAYEIKAQ
jgi:hypothetical protein